MCLVSTLTYDYLLLCDNKSSFIYVIRGLNPCFLALVITYDSCSLGSRALFNRPRAEEPGMGCLFGDSVTFYIVLASLKFVILLTTDLNPNHNG